jgi:hypothetical protein
VAVAQVFLYANSLLPHQWSKAGQCLQVSRHKLQSRKAAFIRATCTAYLLSAQQQQQQQQQQHREQQPASMYQLEPTSRIINRQQFSHSTGSRLGINQLQDLISILFGFSSFVSPPASLISNTQTPKQLCYSIQQLECQQQQAAHIKRHSANNSSRNQAASNNMAMQLHNTVADNMGMRPGDNAGNLACASVPRPLTYR